MILPDVNVLIYAFRHDALQHSTCRAWLRSVVLGGAHFGLSPLALAAVVRVTTDRRVYATPSALSDVIGFCEEIRTQPHCQLVEPGPRHWELFTRLCIETDTTGRRVTDAWYAALAIEWGCEWVTFDRDYARFPGLKWQVPAAG